MLQIFNQGVHLGVTPCPPKLPTSVDRSWAQYLERDEFLEFRVLVEAFCDARVSDEVLRSLSGVDEVLRVVVVRIRRLRPLQKRTRTTVLALLFLQHLNTTKDN